MPKADPGTLPYQRQGALGQKLIAEGKSSEVDSETLSHYFIFK